MRAVDIIGRKRDGRELTPDEIRFVVRGYTEGEIADYQMAALLMAICLRGMSTGETVALTEEMLHSGAVIDPADLGRPRVDKHSTGGVGDKTSLVVAPVVAAAGMQVPMISGRSLAHSGGTLDKLESIPGFRTELSLVEFGSTVERVGAALIGQTAEIAPADKRLYALRDVTATVACRSLMAASIMSKKMAEGISGLVLDVKTGSGAFLKTETEATELALLMIDIARRMNKQAVALITDMNQPLGRMVGNSLEVIEAVETLKGQGPDDLAQLCRELSAEMLVLGRAAKNLDDGRHRYNELLDSGAALGKMREIIEAQHGDARAVDDYSLLPQATQSRTVTSEKDGFVQSLDTEALGHASMLLGAGRTRLDTPIDLAVGLRIDAKIGESVEAGGPLVTMHFNDLERALEAEAIIRKAFVVGPEPVPAPRLIKNVLR